MALSDTVAAQLLAIQTGETAVLTAAITQAFQDGETEAGSGGITSAQEQIDIAAAVATATAPLNAQISGLQLAATQEQALLASVQAAAAALVALLNPPAPTT